MRRIAIIGGGASGLACAVAAAQSARRVSVDAEIVVYEASDRVGRTILATGNGRCNFSNARIDASLYHNSEYASDVLQEFELQFNADGSRPNGVVAFFEDRGFAWREEGEGRLYPQANKASVVLDILRACAKEADVLERTNVNIESVDPPHESRSHFTMKTREGEFIRAECVVIACGGNVSRNLLGSGIPYSEPHPVLCPLATEPSEVKHLNNIRVKASVALLRKGECIAVEMGEVLFRKYGVSGISVFNLSRVARKGDVLAINMLPTLDAESVKEFAEDRRKSLASVYSLLSYSDYLRGLVLPLVSEVVLKRCGVAEDDECTCEGAAKAIGELTSFKLLVEGVAETEHAQVRRGGFDPYAFDFKNMQSLAVPGLFVTGEALDVDGPCGGYNLHWAFATGILAGKASVES